MHIIAGLGNPGREYANTRHNVGYMTLDILAERWGVDIRRRRFHGVFGEGLIGQQKVVLVKPVTYMNDSGVCVRDIFNWYKCGHDQLILVYDDIDLPLGHIRIRGGGSSGTHNGMRSVIYQLGFDDFPRVRVGIGRAEGEKGLVAHVLSMPGGEQMQQLVAAMQNAADAVELVVGGGLQQAQAKFNRKHSTRPLPEADEQQ